MRAGSPRGGPGRGRPCAGTAGPRRWLAGGGPGSGAPVYVHPLGRPVFDSAPRAAAMYGLPWSPQPAPDREFAEGQELALGALRFTVMHAPGHAPGHVVIHGHGVAIAGATPPPRSLRSAR